MKMLLSVVRNSDTLRYRFTFKNYCVSVLLARELASASCISWRQLGRVVSVADVAEVVSEVVPKLEWGRRLGLVGECCRGSVASHPRQTHSSTLTHPSTQLAGKGLTRWTSSSGSVTLCARERRTDSSI